MGTLLDDKEEYSRKQSLMDQALNQSRTKTALDEAATEVFSPAAQAAEVYHLQSVLPKYSTWLTTIKTAWHTGLVAFIMDHPSGMLWLKHMGIAIILIFEAMIGGGVRCCSPYFRPV
jgi:hypothetical protein